MTLEEQLKLIILQDYKSVRAFAISNGLSPSTVDSALRRQDGIKNSSIGTMLKVFDALNLDIESVADGQLAPRHTRRSAPAQTNTPPLSNEALQVAKDYTDLDQPGKRVVRVVLDDQTQRVREGEQNSGHTVDSSPDSQHDTE